MFYEELSDALEGVYDLLDKVESTMISTQTLNLSINEIHLLEAIGQGEEAGTPVGGVAERLSITPASVTVAVNKLEKKGYVTKSKSQADARVVYVRLTPKGMSVNRVHRRFHRNMAAGIAEGMTPQEQEVLLRVLGKMNRFLQEKVTQYERVKRPGK
ncbi:MAG TPA: MarR family transcriptional regulator [Candidatus Gallacutalibacter stercoravium]|nr:MarR family transcriptional regulator [Candidatus Gallacutalibacter stercoravium]